MFLEQFDKVLSLVPAHQGLLFFVIFLSLFVSTKKSHYLFMAYYKLSIFLFFIISFAYYYEELTAISQVFYFTLPITFLVLPTFYLYIDSITQLKSSSKSKIFYHFIPSIVISLLLIPYLLMPYSEKIEFINYGFSHPDKAFNWVYILWTFRLGVYIGLIGQMIAYPILFYKLIKRHHKNIEFFFSYTEKINLKWLNVFISVFIAFFILSFFTLFVGINEDIGIRIVINVIFALVNLYFGIKAITQQNIYSLLKDKFKIASDLQIENSSEKIEYENIKKKYANSSLSPQFKDTIIEKLEEFLKTKPYYNSKITIEDFSDALDTNTRYLSQIINEHYKVNFFTFINNYRIEDSKKILLSESGNIYTIEAIANMVGFHSKSSFNVAFKKNTGYTPTDFRKINQKL